MRIFVILGLVCLTQINLSYGLECNVCATLEDFGDTCKNMKSLNADNANLGALLSKVISQPKALKTFCTKITGTNAAGKDFVNREKVQLPDTDITEDMCNGKLLNYVEISGGAKVHDACACSDRDYCNGSISIKGSLVVFIVSILGLMAANSRN